MEEEHEELHAELAKATTIRSKVGEAAKKVAKFCIHTLKKKTRLLFCSGCNKRAPHDWSAVTKRSCEF